MRSHLRRVKFTRRQQSVQFGQIISMIGHKQLQNLQVGRQLAIDDMQAGTDIKAVDSGQAVG